MGIGTSKGAFFDDEFQHQAGIPTLPKGDEGMVKKPSVDTGDDNVLPPDEGSYDQPKGQIPVGLKRVVITGKPEDNILDSDSTGEAPGPGDAIDTLFGLNGVKRYKLWPERMLEDLFTTAGKVSRGEVPMWSMTPDGEFHTSVEALEAAHKLMPAANSLPVTVQMRGAGLKALQEYHEAPYETGAHEQFQQLLRQVRRQPSNIVEGEVLPPEAPRPPVGPRMHEEIHPDQMTDEEFLRWGEWQPYGQNATDGRFSMTPEMETRWRQLSIAERERIADGSFRDEGHQEISLAQEPYRWDVDEGPALKDIDLIPQKLRQSVEEAQTSKEMKLFKAGTAPYGEGDKFVFANKDGIGEMRITQRKSGKDLYVNWIGTVGNERTYDPGTFGGMKMKEVIRQLMVEYPHAETISGFRVSGARHATGSGSNNASMRLPGRGKKTYLPPDDGNNWDPIN